MQPELIPVILLGILLSPIILLIIYLIGSLIIFILSEVAFAWLKATRGCYRVARELWEKDEEE